MQICLLEFAVRAPHVWRRLNREYIPPPCASLTTARSCSKWLLPYLCILPLSPIGKFCLHRWKNCPQMSQEKHRPFLCFLQDLSICHARKVSRTCCRSTSPPECRAVSQLYHTSAYSSRTSPYHNTQTHTSSCRSLLKVETWPRHVVLFSVSPSASHTKCLKSLLVLLHAQALSERLSPPTCFAIKMQKDLRCLLQSLWNLIWTLQNIIARDDLFVENTQNSFQGQIGIIWYSLKHSETCIFHARRLLFPPLLLSQRN